MLCDAKLTAKEFSNVHNALCDLTRLAQSMESFVHPNFYLTLTKSIAEIRQALAPSYKREDDIATARSNHYTDLQNQHGLSTIWAINSVDNLYDKHPYVGATKVCYNDYWGSSNPVEIVEPILGDKWIDLYVAADKAIEKSGDDHHVFIEAFMHVGDELVLSTGS